MEDEPKLTRENGDDAMARFVFDRRQEFSCRRRRPTSEVFLVWKTIFEHFKTVQTRHNLLIHNSHS
jgi:hypothetical protein